MPFCYCLKQLPDQPETQLEHFILDFKVAFCTCVKTHWICNTICNNLQNKRYFIKIIQRITFTLSYRVNFCEVYMYSVRTVQVFVLIHLLTKQIVVFQWTWKIFNTCLLLLLYIAIYANSLNIYIYIYWCCIIIVVTHWYVDCMLINLTL